MSYQLQHLIQRAYELQSLLGLDRAAVENVMLIDASCEDIEVDKNLSFLNNFVQQAIEKGARPYIPESERSSALNIDNMNSQYQQETSSQTLRFEAYELPNPATIIKASSTSLSSQTTALVPIPEPTYHKDTSQSQNKVFTLDALSADNGVKLRLDGVQQKWGRPSYSSSSSSSSDASSLPPSSVSATNSNLKTSNGSTESKRNRKVEVPAEKQRLAASLFGSSSSKTERKPVNKVAQTKGEEPQKVKKPIVQPDLLDLGEHYQPVSSAHSADPFTELEGLIGTNSNSASVDSAKEPNLVSLNSNNTPSKNSISTNTNTNTTNSDGRNMKKGPNLQDALEKDAAARQVGVTPSGNNPNLFRDLLA